MTDEANGEAGDGPSVEALCARRAEIEAIMERHPALLKVQEMEEIDRARELYVRNANDLFDAIDALNHGDLGFHLFMRGDEVAWDDEDGAREFFIEVGRRWHNYVAGAKTVVDHMRIMFRAQPKDLLAEYEQKIRELILPHDVVHFVHESRNVALHRGVFTMGAAMRYDRGRLWFEVRCLTNHLLNRYESWWNAGAQRYLRAHAPNVTLSDVVEEYAAVVDVLYGWHRDRFYDYHHPTLKEFEHLAAEFREISEILEPGRLPEHDPEASFVTPEAMNDLNRTGAKPSPPARAKTNHNKKRKKRKKRQRRRK